MCPVQLLEKLIDYNVSKVNATIIKITIHF